MNLEQELSVFTNFSGRETEQFQISSVSSYILHLKIKNNSPKKTLGFLGLVHGNEYLGLPILNSLIGSILDGSTSVDSDIYFALGNIPAAFANKRFMDEDLNRAFGKSDTNTSESKRARELETLMLNHCDLLLDIHQTISQAADPFFIFQYSSERCLSILEKWNPGIPVVLQEDQIGENTGLSTDEYLRSLGKFGTALELGQLGTSEHYDLGLSICKKILQSHKSHTVAAPILKLSGVYKVKDSSYKLDPDWKNLKSFVAGERLGTFDGGVIFAPTSGYMLFPRYRTLTHGEDLFSYCTAREDVDAAYLCPSLETNLAFESL